MEKVGDFLYGDLWECSPEILKDAAKLTEIVLEAAKRAWVEVQSHAFHPNSHGGVDGVVVIAESHLIIHTFPELGVALVDVFTCGAKAQPWEALLYIPSELGAAVTRPLAQLPRPYLGRKGVILSREEILQMLQGVNPTKVDEVVSLEQASPATTSPRP